MKKIWVNKAKNFKEAEEFDREYYQKMTAAERLNVMQELREIYLKFPQQKRKQGLSNARRKRLCRVVKVVQ